MARDLKNKVVVLTGGARGIGYEISDQFLKNGAKALAILDVNVEQGTEAAKSLNSKYGDSKAEFFKCDVSTDLEKVSKDLINKYKTIDVLVNNAAIVNEFSVRNTIEVNLMAVMEWSVKFFEHMRTDKGGKGGTIVNLCSIYGFRISEYLPYYNAAKFGVMGFTKSFGHEFNYVNFGVRVVAICPGFTKTQMAAETKLREPVAQVEFEKIKDVVIWQKIDAVGKAAVEVFERADSGTAWLIEESLPIEQV